MKIEILNLISKEKAEFIRQIERTLKATKQIPSGRIYSASNDY
jgi:hypothetical protein